MRGKVTAGQPLDLEAELAQPYLSEVDQTIVAAQGVMQLVHLGLCDLIALGPHDANHHLEQSKGTAKTSAGPLGKAAQDGRGEPRVRVHTGEESTIEDENAAYLRPARRFTPL